MAGIPLRENSTGVTMVQVRCKFSLMYHKSVAHLHYSTLKLVCTPWVFFAVFTVIVAVV